MYRVASVFLAVPAHRASHGSTAVSVNEHFKFLCHHAIVPQHAMLWTTTRCCQKYLDSDSKGVYVMNYKVFTLIEMKHFNMRTKLIIFLYYHSSTLAIIKSKYGSTLSCWTLPLAISDIQPAFNSACEQNQAYSCHCVLFLLIFCKWQSY